MSGRGRDINVPAWMARAKQQQLQPLQPQQAQPPQARRSRSRSRSPSRVPSSSSSRHYNDRAGSNSYNRDSSRDYHHPRDNRYNNKRRSPPRNFYNHRGGGGGGRYYNDPYAPSSRRGMNNPNRPLRKGEVYFQSAMEERDWVENRRKKRLNRTSKFDIEPTEESLLREQNSINPDHILQLHKSQQTPNTTIITPSGVPISTEPQQTRHARRLYIGQLPLDLNESEVHKFFRDCIYTATGMSQNDDPILSVYINRERRFAFVEFKTIEICTACLALDGIDVLGKGKVKVKRPNDYNPLLAANTPEVSQLKQFDVSKLGIVSTSVPDGPNKIFIGGLPYHLTEDQVMELLRAFGPIRAFHLVKTDVNSNSSKGYCFVEYADEKTTPVAILGLNGMDMGGGKVLSARIAASEDNAVSVNVGKNVVEGVDIDALLNVALAGKEGEQEQEKQPASTILVLLNMVMDEDLESDENHEDLVDEVKSECQKYGNLVSIIIPKHADSYASSAIKKIFLQYSSEQEALHASKQLTGRQFGSSTVQTMFFNKDDFLRGNLY